MENCLNSLANETWKTGKIGQFLYGNIFGTVVCNIIADHHKFFYIFMLLVVGNAGELGVGIKIGTPKSHKKRIIREYTQASVKGMG